jgi:hypothetical protein
MPRAIVGELAESRAVQVHDRNLIDSAAGSWRHGWAADRVHEDGYESLHWVHSSVPLSNSRPCPTGKTLETPAKLEGVKIWPQTPVVFPMETCHTSCWKPNRPQEPGKMRS